MCPWRMRRISHVDRQQEREGIAALPWASSHLWASAQDLVTLCPAPHLLTFLLL